MRGLGLGFTTPVGIWGVFDVCLYFGCDGVGGVGGSGWRLGTWSGRIGWCYVCVSCCESGLCV